MIISISWRNIWRNKLRSLIVILAVTLGLFGILFMIAISNGMVVQKIDASINNELAHIQVHDTGFIQDPSLHFFLENSDNIEKEIQAIPGVKSVCSMIKAMAMASTAATLSGIMINAIYPQK